MLALFLVCLILLLSCFSFVSCFAFTDYEKHCFPCNSSIFGHAGYKVVIYFFSFMFLVLFVFLFCIVLFVSILDIWFVLCCVCVVWFSLFLQKNRTKWFCCLHLVVIFPFCCFVLNFVFFLFFYSFQKKTPQKSGHSKNPKKQKCKKKKKGTKKKSVSAVVFTDSVLKIFGVGLKFSFLAENTINIVVSASFQTSKNTPKLAKMLSQNLFQGWVKTWSKYVAQQNWTKFWLKKMVFFCLLFARFSLKAHSPGRKKKILEKQKKKEKTWTKFWLKKRLFLDQVLTLQHIYIYLSLSVFFQGPWLAVGAGRAAGRRKRAPPSKKNVFLKVRQLPVGGCEKYR